MQTIHFPFLCLVEFFHLDTFPAGWQVGWLGEWCQSDIKDHLSPAKAEARAEFGKMKGIYQPLATTKLPVIKNVRFKKGLITKTETHLEDEKTKNSVGYTKP